jgi:excisionase family DNA binding protein
MTEKENQLTDYPASKLWTVRKLSELSNFSEDYIWRLVREERLKALKIGRSIRIKHEDYVNFINSN